MNYQNILSIIIKAFLIFFILLIYFFFFRINIITLLTPFYEKISEMSYKNYHIEILIKQEKTDKVVISATPLKNIIISPKQTLPAGTTIEGSISLLHCLVPILILLMVIFALPIHSFRQLIILILLTIPMIFLVSALTAPLQLLAQLEIGFHNAALKAGFHREESWVLTWSLLTEGGGRWLLPALFGLICSSTSLRISKN